MTTTALPLAPDSAAALALSSTHEGAVLALDLLARAVAEFVPGSAPADAWADADAMRRFLLGKVRDLAADFRPSPGRRS